MLGAAPGTGKTGLASQLVIDAMPLNPELKVLIANMEMAPATLLDRQLARLTGIDLTTIRKRKFTEERAERLGMGLQVLEDLGNRLAFLQPPYSLENLAEAADSFGASLLVVDFVQAFKAGTDTADRRGLIDGMMANFRAFAEVGVCLLVVSSVGRTRDKDGRSSYDGLNLACFKESGNLEFLCDSAYLLLPDYHDDEILNLKCVKNRNGEPRDVPLQFLRPYQRFLPIDVAGGNLADLRGKRR